jgi:DNA helicase-2/ATP-dependent DNA helicase PcrA
MKAKISKNEQKEAEKIPKEKPSFEERYKGLNEEQRQAVDTIDGPVMVIAGPGSGKTEILSLRAVKILHERDLHPRNILCLTFTDAAAANMRNRLVGLIGADAYRIAIHTFHSFGIEIINRYPERFYGGATFMPADTVTQIEFLEDIFSRLNHNDPLRSQHNEKFVYINKALSAIGNLKKAGLTPDDFEKIIQENKKGIEEIDPLVQSVFEERVSKKLFGPAREIAEKIGQMDSQKLPGNFKPFASYFASSLHEALDAAEVEGTAPLTEWKGRFVKKGDDKVVHVADVVDMEKFTSLASIYRKYVDRMREEGYYDYNDMILDAISALKNHPGVRSELQERYQYILVDEFQDTNNAQMQLLGLLTDHPVHEGRPNIMVVGDDDQAIFKFQGAEIANIRAFAENYKDQTVIVLKKNYRSTQRIVDAARRVINQGKNRLETAIPIFRKELIAERQDISAEHIFGKEFLSRDTQYQWIVTEIQRLIEKEGMRPKEIAIIGREHKELESLVPYFHAAKIPLAYEREENVLRSPHIQQLITMARFADSLMKKSAAEEELLPEILSYPFWQIDRHTLWELSVTAGEARTPWIAAMKQKGGQLAEIANFFVNLAAKAKQATAEEILHDLIGGPQVVIAEEDEDEDAPTAHEMFSPFRSFYFGTNQFKKNRAEYLHFLSSLQSFVRTFREYRPGKSVLAADMLAFVDMHEKNNLAINNVSQFTNDKDAVQFMTAHKAKGLEFEGVFIINCEEGIWADTRGGRDMPLPSNLPIGPAGDTMDDKLRLFYVAMTRAKKLLYFTSSRRDFRGKPIDRLGFLAPKEGEQEWLVSELVDMGETDQIQESLLVGQWDASQLKQFTPDEKALLAPILEKYQLSVTHLQNFLNVADAGPLAFLERNLLMFPQPKTVDGAFGTAIHTTIKHIYSYLKSAEAQPTIEQILDWFEEYLRDERLNVVDYARKEKQGRQMLESWWEAKKDSLKPSDVIEFNFRNQGVVVEGAQLTGKVDRMIINGSQINVCDFKTGKAIDQWELSDPYAKIKSWKYKQQLIFYKLLIEHSRDYGNFHAPEGFIEFVEPVRGSIVDLPLVIDLADEDRLKALIKAVFAKIQALDFPDISGYSKDMKGIIQFEDDLLNGTI